ncbi:MAG: carbonic anhydrase [Planctomycetota bacterium]
MASAIALLAAATPSWAGDHEKSAAHQSLDKLKEGNARFVAGELQHPNLSAERREELAKGQSPYAVIVSCSDSRVPPELVFDAGPGDLFVIRVAGNVVGDDAMASIEYAVAVLGSPLVVVMGHESCGAVDAAVKAQTEGAEFGGQIHDLVETIRPSVIEAVERASGDDLLETAIHANADRVVEELKRSRPFVGTAAKDGKIEIIAARYDLDQGTVSFYDDHHGGHSADAHAGHAGGNAHDHGDHDHGHSH